MPILVKMWRCPLCRTTFSKKKPAADCETDCKGKQELETLRKERQKYFPIYHSTDDRYEKHCVGCGKKLLEWEREYDGHRNEVGKLMFEEKSMKLIMGGRRCKECALAFEKKLMILQQSKNKTVQKILTYIAVGKL